MVAALQRGQSPLGHQPVEPVPRRSAGISQIAGVTASPRLSRVGSSTNTCPDDCRYKNSGSKASEAMWFAIGPHAVGGDQRDHGIVRQCGHHPPDGVVDRPEDGLEALAGDRRRRVGAEQMRRIDAVAERVPRGVQLRDPHDEEVPLREALDEPARDVAAPANAGDQQAVGQGAEI